MEIIIHYLDRGYDPVNNPDVVYIDNFLYSELLYSGIKLADKRKTNVFEGCAMSAFMYVASRLGNSISVSQIFYNTNGFEAKIISNACGTSTEKIKMMLSPSNEELQRMVDAEYARLHPAGILTRFFNWLTKAA